jgi:hypothetical protein
MWPIILALSISITVIGITLCIICRDIWKNQFAQEAQENEEWWKRQKDDMDTDLREKDKSK